METAFHYPSDFSLFLVIFGNDIFWNSQISIGWLVSTFRCWQFSRSSFFCTKNITKKLILEFQLSAPHLVGFGSQKEFPFDRCTYRGSLFLHFFNNFKFFEFSGYQIEVHSKGSQFSIFFVPGSDFRPCWCQDMPGNYTKKYIFQNRIDFLKL